MYFKISDEAIELLKYLHSLSPEEREIFFRKAGINAEKEFLNERVSNLLSQESPINRKLYAALPDFLKPSS